MSALSSSNFGSTSYPNSANILLANIADFKLLFTTDGAKNSTKFCFIRGYRHVASFLFPIVETFFPEVQIPYKESLSLQRTSRIG